MAIAVERYPLSQLLGMEHRAESEPVLPFTATRVKPEIDFDLAQPEDYIEVVVTALMIRTAAYHTPGNKYDTGVVRLDRIFVDPDSIEWRPRTTQRDSENGQARAFNGVKRTAPQSPEARQQVRAVSDERALKDQATKHQEGISIMATQRISITERQELAAKGLKRCPRCKKDLPIAEINSAGYCKSCVRERSAEYYLSKHDGKATVPQRSPIKRSIAGKKARAVPQSTDAPAHVAIPPESLPTVIVLDHTTRTVAGDGAYSPVLATSPAGEHYRTMAIEPIQYIEANNLPFHEANVVKYVSRWKLKAGVEDLRKARFYIDRLIELEEAKVG